VVTGEEDDVFAPAEARRALVDEGLGAQQWREDEEQGQQEEAGHAEKRVGCAEPTRRPRAWQSPAAGRPLSLPAGVLRAGGEG
jgi:hypothetical protein